MFLSHGCFGQLAWGTLQGTVMSGEDGELIPFARVIVFESGTDFTVMSAGVQSDLDGNFRLNSLLPGRYDLRITDSFYNMDTLEMVDIDVKPEQITFLGDIEMNMNHYRLSNCPPIVPSPSLRTLNQDPFGRSITIEKEDIRRQ